MAQQKEKPSVLINLGDSVNTKYDELAPLITPDGSRIYYGRRNHPFNTYSNRKFTDCVDIFYSKYDSINKRWKNGRHMPEPFNQRIFNGVESISADGKIVYIRGAYKNNHYKGNGLSVSYENLGQWSLPLRLKIKAFKRMNRGATSNFFMANDGKVLLMSFSKTEGGVTNDLFVSFLQENGNWSKPQELNMPANSKKYNEQIPFLASDNETLYFSSDREGGYGLNDIWVTRRLDSSWVNWSEPIVIDTPVNSKRWEGYCSIDAQGEYIYFVSNNNSIKGSQDIVKAKLGERFRPKPVALVAGRALNSEKVPLNTLIRFIDVISNKEYARTRSSEIDGGFKVTLPIQRRFFMTTEREGYLPISEEVDLTGDNFLLSMDGRDIISISIDQLRDLEALKNLDLKGASLVKRPDGGFNLRLSDGSIFPLRIRDDGSIEVITDDAKEVMTYFLPINRLPGIDSNDYKALLEEPYVPRRDRGDGSVEMILASGKQFLLTPTKRGYRIAPINFILDPSVKNAKKGYSDIYKIPVESFQELDSTEREELGTVVVVTHIDTATDKQEFTSTALGVDYLLLRDPGGIFSLLPSMDAGDKREIVPLEEINRQRAASKEQKMDYLPFNDGSQIGLLPVSDKDGFFYLIPLDAFGLPEEEMEALRKNPFIARRDREDGTTEFTLKSGKKYVLGPSPDGDGYQLTSIDGKNKKTYDNKGIVRIPLSNLGSITDEDEEALSGGVVFAEKGKKEKSYSFSLPSGQRFEIATGSNGFFSITALSGMGNALTLAGLDKNFYLGNLGVGESVLIDNLFFDFGRASLRPESQGSLEKLYRLMDASPQTYIVINGHTDNVGSLAFNEKLSLQRTQSVRQYLVDRGIAEERIKVVGYGPKRPLTDNQSEANRQINRRVEFVILKN